MSGINCLRDFFLLIQFPLQFIHLGREKKKKQQILANFLSRRMHPEIYNPFVFTCGLEGFGKSLEMILQQMKSS